MPRLGNRLLRSRAAGALVVANARYWSTVAPVVRHELRRWERHADAIEDPELRALALAKLRQERFNAEAGAMLATFAPRAQRRDAVQAIVALQLLFDYLDGLTERPCGDPLGEGRRLFAAFTSAVAVGPERVLGAAAQEVGGGAEEYLWALSDTARAAVGRLPQAGLITQAAGRIAARSAEAQIHMHASPSLGNAHLQAWAQSEMNGTPLQWREQLAGAASSVLVLHALIGVAADAEATPARVQKIADSYLSVCVLLTLLDSLVDHEQDATNGQAGYIDLYEDEAELPARLSEIAQRAVADATALEDAPRHLMILSAIAAYYLSAPGAEGAFARPGAARVRSELGPLVRPVLGVMRTWRLAKRRHGKERIDE